MCHLFGMLLFNKLSLINHNIYSDPLCLMRLSLPPFPACKNISPQRGVSAPSLQRFFSESLEQLRSETFVANTPNKGFSKSETLSY